MRRVIGVVLAVVGLTGCAPATMNGVRALGPQHMYEFNAPQNYQAVYRTILNRTRDCYEAGLITAQQDVSGDLYTDIQTGTISVALHGGLGTDVYRVVDVKATSPTSTNVKAYFSMGPVDKYGSIMKKWVFDDYKKCS